MAPENDLDRNKELNSILSDYEQKKADEERLKKLSSHKEEVKAKTSSAFKVVIAIAALAAVLFVTAEAINESGIFRKKQYWAIGQTFDTDYKIQECIGNLWRIRSAIDAYYQKNRIYPNSLDELYVAEKIEPYTCPASGAPYVMAVKNGRAVFSCPNADKHDVESVWSDVKGGPPTVERY